MSSHGLAVAPWSQHCPIFALKSSLTPFQLLGRCHCYIPGHQASLLCPKTHCKSQLQTHLRSADNKSSAQLTQTSCLSAPSTQHALNWLRISPTQSAVGPHRPLGSPACLTRPGPLALPGQRSSPDRPGTSPRTGLSACTLQLSAVRASCSAPLECCRQGRRTELLGGSPQRSGWLIHRAVVGCSPLA